MKECPMCGESMGLSERQVEEYITGQPQAAARTVREWICPECDYFEEADSEG